MAIDPERLEGQLREAFGGTEGQSRVVARQAVDLADSGQYQADLGFELTNDIIIDELSDARTGTPPDRWNWWIGSLELAFGGYSQFGIRQYQA